MKINVDAREALPHLLDRNYEIRDPKDDGRALFEVSLRQIHALVNAQAISAVIKMKRKKFDGVSGFRLLCSANKARQIAGIGKGSKHGEHVTAADDKTCVRDGRTYKHHRNRSRSYEDSCIGARMPDKAIA